MSRRAGKGLPAPWRPVEAEDVRDHHERQFFEAMSGYRFLPAGRILAGAGADRNVTLFNCFVMGAIPDDMGGIFDHLKEAALTMQAGGGIGYDFSTLRPAGALVKGVGADASGPLTFMDVWDSMCRTIMSCRSPPRRNDGHHALRPSGHRGVHRCQAGGPAACACSICRFS